MALMWFVQISHVIVRNEYILDTGTNLTFTAEDSGIQAVGFSYDAVNRDVYGIYTPYFFSGTVRLLHITGNGDSADTLIDVLNDVSDGRKDPKEESDIVWEQQYRNARIDVLGSGEENELSWTETLNPVLKLQRGERYRFEITDPAGEKINGISIYIYGSDRGFFSLYWIVGIEVLVLLSLLYLQYHGIIRIPFAAAWILGLVEVSLIESMAMTPPCVPDGELHFFSSYGMSNLIMQKIPFLRSIAGEVPIGILRMRSFGGPQYLYHFWTDWSSGNELVPRADSFFLIGLMPHYSYVIPAIGLTIARICRLPWQLYLLLGQMMNVLLYAVITFIAVQVKPDWKRAIVAISLLPSTLWLVNSFSYDVWNLAFVILAVAYCGRLADQRQVSVWQLLLAVLLMVAFIPIKFIYFNIALALFLIRPSQWKVKNRRLFTAAIVIVICAGIAVVFAARGAEIITFLGAGGFDGRSDNTVDSTYTLNWALHHPARMILVYLKTFYESGASLFINTFVGDNYQGYIPAIITAGIIVCFCITMNGSADEKVGRRGRVLSWLILIPGILIVMTSFVFVYSTRPEEGFGTITGMQGRYFIPYLICLPYAVRPHKWTASHARSSEYLLASMAMVSILTRFTGIVVG